MSPEAKQPNRLLDRLCWALATLGGLGLVPRIPGTLASLVCLPLIYVLLPQGSWIFLLTTLLIGAVAIVTSSRVARRLSSEDPQCVVLDEVCGMFTSCLPLTLGSFSNARTLGFLGAAFLLFRLFDIWKPGWIGKSQSLPGGWGIVLDDVAAGALSAIFLGLIIACV